MTHLVFPLLACPKCGEARADRLIVTAHDARIACATCGIVYTVDTLHHEAPVKPDDMTAEEWDEYQAALCSGAFVDTPPESEDKIARIESILGAAQKRRGFNPRDGVFMLGLL